MINVKFNLDPTQKILLKRKLHKNGEGQRFLTKEIRRLADPYVPMDTGMLKNTTREQIDKIIYAQPYAQKQYYENKGRGLRGKMWVTRMWSDRGDEIVRSVAKFVGGKAR